MKHSSLAIALLVMILAGGSLSRWAVPQADNPAGGNDPTRPATAPPPGRGPGLLVKGSEPPRKSPRDLQIGEGQPGPAGAPSMFNSVAGPSRTVAQQRPQPASILNRRAIGVNWDALRELRESGSGTLEVDTGSGLLAARVGEVIENPGGGYSLAGGIAGDPLGTFLATVHEDALVASITTGTGLPRRFAISPVAAGEHEFQEVDPRQGPVCGGALIPPPGPEADTAEEDGPKGESGKGTRPPPRSHHKDNHQTTIDIMIVYTVAARNAGGGEAAMEASANQAIRWANAAFSNSGVELAFRLVHTGEVSYDESGDASTDLNRLRATSDGSLDEVHTLRDIHGADIVSLWTGSDWGDVAGKAFGSRISTQNTPSWAFNVCTVRPSQLMRTFTHECGHILGCGHAVDQNIQPGPQRFSYSAGWRWTGNSGTQWRSIMTYAPGSITQFFSNPLVAFDGGATGAPLANNVRTLQETMEDVAAFRDPPELSINITSRDISAAGGTGRFTVSANRAWNWSSNAEWLTSPEPITQNATRPFNYVVARNTSSQKRTAAITFTSGNLIVAHTVNQMGGTEILSLEPYSRVIAAGGGAGIFSISSSNPWNWSVDSDWIMTNEPSTQTGNQTFTYTVAANITPESRTATITVTSGGIVCAYRVLQAAGDPEETLVINPPSRSISAERTTGRFTVLSEGEWTWTSDAVWLTSPEATSQTGNQLFNYIATPNTTPEDRIASITVTSGDTNRTHTVIQEGLAGSLTLRPAGNNLEAEGGTGSFYITSNITWTWSSNALWLTSNASTSQSGNQTITYSVAANTSTQARTATITISAADLTRTHTVSQSARTLTVSPTTSSIAATGGNGAFTVSSNTAWNWSDNAAWLTSNEATTQSGNQTFSYSVARNTSTQARTATITLTAGGLARSHIVTQAAAEITLTVRPTTRRIPATGGNDTFTVSSNTNWNWS
ncbi:MAG TPA: BACON domain-containing carbohydrate-binding protein, partial [Roseibacillus sp.]|nr:BACON domain-containing carbohydrate-binding protein [Roseibacillus sp.]